MKRKLALSMLALFAALCASFFSFVPSGIAQTSSPEVFMTWHTDSYVPNGYPGKALPIPRSNIIVSFEVISGGKPANISGETVYWYVNDAFKGSTVGVQSRAFTVSPAAVGVMSIRIRLPNYAGGAAQTVLVPIVSPQAVIVAPYAQNQFGGGALQVFGVPFFFNVSDPSALNFSWTINGVAPQNSEDPGILNINLGAGAPVGSALNLSLGISNPARQFESASENLTLSSGQ